MVVSYNWLKTLVELNVSPEKLAEEMSLYSVEVETFNKMVKATNLVVGHVNECVAHPNSDHLHVCQVNLGDHVEQIVCGAPNVEAGQNVIVAKVDAVLPGGTIKASKIRGVESNGMLCSLQELGIENKYVPEKYQNGIYILDEDAPVGAPALEYLCLDDYLIELSLTPNRMDLMSMLGVAQDVAAMYDTKTIPLDAPLHEVEGELNVDVELATEDCYSYYARVVKDVTIADSPQWLKERLIAAGVRPINNVVDATNYVLMLFGQPLHSFDQDKLGNKILVRNATEGEKMVTLDEQERTLIAQDIVITDGEKPVCIAGVMGGRDTEVTNDTKNIVLESAVFKPLAVRKTSNRLNLRSESSVRYERGVDLNRSLEAVNYCCYLLEKYAGGTVVKGYKHAGCEHIEDTLISVSEDFVESYLGIRISKDEIVKICKSLGFNVDVVGEDINVLVPNRRMDVKIKPDLVEEIARMYGYDRLNETLPKMDVEGELTYPQHVRKVIKETLIGLGMSEAVTYSLVNPEMSNQFKVLYSDENEPIVLSHPMTEDHSILRRSLVPSLLESVHYNNARKNYNISLFEEGVQYSLVNGEPVEKHLVAGALQGTQSHLFWCGKKDDVDFYYVKGILEQLFVKLSLDVKFKKFENPCKELHPGRTAEIVLGNKVIGYVGEVHPVLLKKMDLEPTYVFEIALEEIFNQKAGVVAFKSISKVPSVDRDLALVMDKDQPVGEVIDAIYRCDSKMIKNVLVFDLYEGEHIESGKKSVAVRITLESEDTLTDEVINAKMKKILNTLAYCFRIEIRK